MLVETKAQMMDLLMQGAFGNTTRVWESIPAYLQSDFEGTVALRSLIPGGKMYPTLAREDIEGLLIGYEALFPDYYVQEVVDASHYTFAGELKRDGVGYFLQSTTVKKPMREALRKQSHAYGNLCTLMVLDHYCEPEDKEHLMHLLDEYPEHVIEFTCLDIPAGLLNRRMIVWEVRAY